MTQEIVYCAFNGVVLASDSLIVHVRDDGRREFFAARKLFPLEPWAALVTAGAYVGIELSRRFVAKAQEEGLSYQEHLAPALQAFFEQEYGRFIADQQTWFDHHPEAHRSLYVLLAGRVENAPGLSWQTMFLSSEEHVLPFQSPAVGEILTIPRRLGLEGQLMFRLKGGASLEDVAAFCYSALSILAERDPEQVGGPFHVAILDPQGFRWWQPSSEEGR